jgi:hypothetical protein
MTLYPLPFPLSLPMAESHLVKQYVAQWFQLGKSVVIQSAGRQLLPQTVFRGDRYTSEFDRCWQEIIDPSVGDCYLEGTDQTIGELLTPSWEIIACSRCQMPIPLKVAGITDPNCPCFDLVNWPNNEVPKPTLPTIVGSKLVAIQRRLSANSS